MGGFYTNYTLRGPSQKAVARALEGRKAIVSPESNRCVVVFDEKSDAQDKSAIGALAMRLSGSLYCPVLAVLDHDDDILWYQLYENGRLTDQYDSWPDYFNPSPKPSGPAGGNAERLCRAFGASDPGAVEAILRKPTLNPGAYLFAHQRHAELVLALGMPEFAILKTYASFERGEIPVGFSAQDFLRA